jgi:hypothetical protein
MSDTTHDLSRYDEDYRKAKQADTPPPFRPVPDGKYQVIVENVELTTTRTTGNPMLKWRLRIAGPTMADRILWKSEIITERTMPYVTKNLTLCGLSMQSFGDLPSRLPELTNLRLEVTKRGRTDRPDEIYFDRNLTAVPATMAAAAASDGYQTPTYDQADRLRMFDDDLNDDLPF